MTKSQLQAKQVDFSATLTDLQKALEETGTWLRANTPEVWAWRSVSAWELRDANQAVGKWVSSGQFDSPPKVNDRGYVAGLFQLGRTASDIRAYRAVCASASMDLIEAALPPLRQQRLAVPFTMTRGLIERTAAAESLIQNVAPILESPAPTTEEAFRKVFDTGEAITVALFGTKVDCEMLADSDVPTLSAKAVAYRPVEYAINLTAKQVLTAVDRLNKRIAGSRVAYDVLCEFLHPNVGDLLAASLDSSSFLDRLGIRHLEIILGRGSADLRKRPDVAHVLAAATGIATDIVSLIPIIHQELDRLAEIITSRTRKAMRPLLKKNMHFFRRSDLCPCHSGKTIGVCCLVARRS
jgi:hypothetical protein